MGCGNVLIQTDTSGNRLGRRQLASTAPRVKFTIVSPLGTKTAKELFDSYSTVLKTPTMLDSIKQAVNGVTSINVDKLVLDTTAPAPSPAPEPAPGGAGSNSAGSASSGGGGSSAGIGGGVGGVLIVAGIVAYWYFYMRKPTPPLAKQDDHIPSMSNKMNARATMENPMMNPNNRDSIPLFVPQPLSADANKRASTWDTPTQAHDYGDQQRRLDPAYQGGDVNNPMQGGGRLSEALGKGANIVNQGALYSHSHANTGAGNRSSVGTTQAPMAHPTQEEL